MIWRAGSGTQVGEVKLPMQSYTCMQSIIRAVAVPLDANTPPLNDSTVMSVPRAGTRAPLITPRVVEAFVGPKLAVQQQVKVSAIPCQPQCDCT